MLRRSGNTSQSAEIKPRIVIVTGSSTGIGAAAAIRFAEEHVNITLHGRQEKALQNVKEECLRKGAVKVHVVVGDVTDEAVRKRLVDETVKEFGGIDVLVNNVGIISDSPCGEALETYDLLFEVNVRSLVGLTMLAMPHLVNSKGNVVNVSSILSTVARPTAAYYCMTKAAVDHYGRSLALEFGPKGVRVNNVNPALIKDTELRARQGLLPQPVDPVEERAKETYPLRRAGLSREVAEVIAFLASDKASFITGASVPVDGGYCLI